MRVRGANKRRFRRGFHAACFAGLTGQEHPPGLRRRAALKSLHAQVLNLSQTVRLIGVGVATPGPVRRTGGRHTTSRRKHWGKTMTHTHSESALNKLAADLMRAPAVVAE